MRPMLVRVDRRTTPDLAGARAATPPERTAPRPPRGAVRFLREGDGLFAKSVVGLEPVGMARLLIALSAISGIVAIVNPSSSNPRDA